MCRSRSSRHNSFPNTISVRMSPLRILLLICLWSCRCCIQRVEPAARLVNNPDAGPTMTKNPFANGGCLHQRKANWTGGIRVCGSEDPPEAATLGYCRDDDPFDYMEIRIHGQNWEASFFETWILQIILSEILHVPTSVETSRPNVKVNFYDIDSRFEYGDADDWGCLAKGVQVGDCRNVVNAKGRTYQSCCHFVPESWPNNGVDTHAELERSGFIEPALPTGTIGEEHWFIPKFTAERDPTLLSYIGMAGEENRRKLAERFLRPATWREYCEEVSPTQCLDEGSNDTVAPKGPPASNDPNGNRFFVEGGVYQGHFRKTRKNDCDINPFHCTGHIFDYPCSWTSFVIPQAYHLGISVEGDGVGEGGSGGYAYSQLVDALRAANATKSDILIFWWTPEAVRMGRIIDCKLPKCRSFSSFRMASIFYLYNYSSIKNLSGPIWN